MKENVIVEKSYLFAVNILKAVKTLTKFMESYILVKQLVRAGTSVGANIEESQGGHTKKDFLHKMNISYKEARECKYWIRLIIDTQINSKAQLNLFNSLFNDADELCKILYAILNSSK